mgnify:FL=1
MESNALMFLGSVAFIGMILKVAILFNVSIKSQIAESFVVVCLFFLLQNVSEFLGYFTYNFSEQVGLAFVHIYMITLYFLFPSVLLLALTLVEFKHLKTATTVLYGIAFCISVAHLGGYVVDGIKFVGWSAVTTPGSYYWAAISYPMLMAISTVIVLFKHYIANSSFEIRNR